MHQKMRAIIVDDEQPARNNLRAMLTHCCPEIEIVGESDAVKSSVQLIEEQQPDLVFLDIDIKGGTGFDVLARFPNPGFSFLFVTAFDQYAIKAFKFSALDYLLKPVDPAELRGAVKKMDRQNSRKDEQTKMEVFTANSRLTPSEKKIVLSDASNIYVVTIKEIIRCESANSYTVFYLEDGRNIVITETLKSFENMLPDMLFFRPHQSHLINLSFISHYHKAEGDLLMMKNGDSIPISTRRKSRLIAKVQEYANNAG